MYQTLQILPGVTLRCIRDQRFKQAAFSLQFLRPMSAQEAGMNAMLPAVLLRGCREYPDLRHITEKLDDLYGAAIGTLVRRIGDYQTTGFYCNFMEDRFAFSGDAILAPMLHFVGQLLLQPITEDGGFSKAFTESEQRNLIAAIEYERSDKRAYAARCLLEIMCAADSFGVPRLGTIEQVREIDPKNLYTHYQTLLRDSPLELFYVGTAAAETVASILRSVFAGLPGRTRFMPPQTPFHPGQCQHITESQDIAQGKLSMGFTTPITNRDPRFAAMQVCNAIFGSGMTSKLFMQVREAMSLCYAISSSYYSSKGILTVNAGIDSGKQEPVIQAILDQLAQCQSGNISHRELQAAKQSILSGLQAVYDSPGAMEGFFSVSTLSGMERSPQEYVRQVEAVTGADVAAAAQTLCYHSSFFLKGEDHA